MFLLFCFIFLFQNSRSVAFEDEECNRLLDAFITDSVRILLKLYQAMGRDFSLEFEGMKIGKIWLFERFIQLGCEDMSLEMLRDF